ncbi:hypothetical protein PF005_g24242 [Phytophthora fragariae]|uniref:BSD domain-containing protein n=1 Tax=Phytophthora fragariae TaxID=53985 RepID=A0A6A3ILD1_9STRA|nr:hypothetical protein PF003_g36319 [Phytophthora fragariae]KAE8924752.1 hypothetical protein PF009_g25025 [Phytophthora fragariae]KAE8980904.1 hypothetical protein PF011_g22243 [Phytophthora fragariae]KAE9076812.1 hypothetical protein PF010_g23755 [Phytophthora fragariae]KAE9077569.1 hypothetical protein PF007_g24193 [Phytophthora fragariae]
MAARMSEIGMSAVRASEIGMRHSAANLQMMVGTVANKAHGIATVLTRSTSRGRKPQLKTIPNSQAEDELSPMSQLDEQPGPEAEVPEAEPVQEKQQQQKELEKDEQEEKDQQQENKDEYEQEKELPPLFPWEVRTDDGETRENPAVKEKILELAIYRRTFVEPADGEEEYVFDYAMLKGVARELLLSNPNLREKRETLVESAPVPVVTEELFWRNYFLRCNAVRVAEGLPSYLPEVEATPTPSGPLARLRRGLFGGNKKRSSVNSGKSRRGFLVVGRSSSSDSNKTAPSEDDLSDLELDVDGEIEKELVKRRPSRAVEQHLQPVPPSQTNAAAVEPEEANEAENPENTSTIEAKCKEPEDTPDASSPGKANSDREEYAPILV